jgi:hypothetical protein
VKLKIKNARNEVIFAIFNHQNSKERKSHHIAT